MQIHVHGVNSTSIQIFSFCCMSISCAKMQIMNKEFQIKQLEDVLNTVYSHVFENFDVDYW